MQSLVLALSLLLSGTALAGADADIKANFDRYRAATLKHDGVAAAAELDDDTAAYYGRMRTAALTAPDVHGLPLIEKLLVLRLRLELSPDQLDAMDGRMLLAHAIGRGWISTQMVEKGGLGAVKVDGARAEAPMTFGGKPTAARLAFKRGRSGWKIDLMPMIQAAAPQLAALQKQAKLTEDELVLKMLEEVTHRKVPAEVWRPIAPAPRR